MNDSISVTHRSEELILNLLNDYSGPNQDDPKLVKGIDAVSGIIIDLGHVYRDSGHSTMWSVIRERDKSLEAYVNPLEVDHSIVGKVSFQQLIVFREPSLPSKLSILLNILRSF